MNTLSKSFVTGTLALVLLTTFTGNVQAVQGQWSSTGSTIYYNDGKIGIGTNNPFDPLHVHKPSAGNYDSSYGSALIGNNHSSFWFGSWNYQNTSGSNNIASNSYLTNQWYRRKGGVESWVMGNYVTNNNTGNFAISYASAGGTDNSPVSYVPYFKISAAGTVSVKQLKVSANHASWPDYVFDQNYNLKSLEEVEQFIKTNRHLEGIPTAEEIEKDGISVGTILEAQMKKIEELTLYAIEQDKQMNSLDERISKLESLIK